MRAGMIHLLGRKNLPELGSGKERLSGGNDGGEPRRKEDARVHGSIDE